MEMKDVKKVLRRAAPPAGLMRISEAALVAGVCAETLRRRVRRGELAAWGSPRRVALADILEQFMPNDLREVVDSSRIHGETSP
jgi:hypothetical protein